MVERCICDNGWDSAQPAPLDPYDLSWVRKWAAIGDSYSAGIGSGDHLGDSGHCDRYDQSYPAFMQTHELLPQSPPAQFDFLACSGATTPKVLRDQVPELDSDYDFITVSTGGNDVGLTSILNSCIFQWNPFTDCEKDLRKSADKIRDKLPGNLDSLYSALKTKVKPGRKIYVTGYAQFFDNSTTACDRVSWAFWWNFGDKEKLTVERRTMMNELVAATNSVIEAAVKRAGDQFEFVGYDQYFSLLEGRFCEVGVKEPSKNRNGLLFFQMGTSSDDPTKLEGRDAGDADTARRELDEKGSPGPLVERTANANSEPLSSDMMQPKAKFSEKSSKQKRSAVIPGHRSWKRGRSESMQLQERQDDPDWQTVEEYIKSSIQEATAQDPTLSTSDSDNRAPDASSKAKKKFEVTDIVPDKIKRVFHPRPGGYAVIANLIIWRIAAGVSKEIGGLATFPGEAEGYRDAVLELPA
ncbi:Lipase 1 [Colletotrichum trifolii]|uniref:Lipase 1 n=1 Tax=Colletotrichum trifolii TaxID=5466 RepID=A0A4V6QF08_COLTR|nr:Lipase 1 [Colletotrichum trifolii]